MKHSILLAFFLFSVFVLRAQKEEDPILLSHFWNDFKIALNTKDVDKLADLIKFPFGCAICDPLIDEAHPYVLISKKLFKEGQYQIFFKQRLIEMVNKYQMPKDIGIFNSRINESSKNWMYSFSFVASDSPGRQVFFEVEKVKGKFKIRWVWTVP